MENIGSAVKINQGALALARTLAQALEAGQLCRVVNDYQLAATQLWLDGKLALIVEGCIVYPGFTNCTKAGTPCRVGYLKYEGGFGKAGWEDVQAYTIELSNKWNAYDWETTAELDEPYYGSDRWLEDGAEAFGGEW